MKKVKEFFNVVKSHKKLVGNILGMLILVLFIVDISYAEYNKPDEVTYNEFLSDLESGKIDTLYYANTDEMMRYTLLNDETSEMTQTEREEYKYDKSEWRMTKYPANEDFRKEMLGYGVNLVIKSFDPISISIISVLSSVLLPVLLFFAMYKMLIGGTGKLDKDSLIQQTDVKFSDVIGHDEIIKDLQFIVELMKDPSKGEKLGASTPRGMLFSGEPGTGKTLLAKAIAGESGVPFLYMNASSFIELYVGTGAKRVRELFKEAKKNAPCIIFIDEIDAVGKKRNKLGSTSEDNQTINALLQEMDGFNTRDGIFIIAATNNADSLDKALVRSGRFDRQVVVAPPKDWTVRRKLFEHYLTDVAVADDIDLKSVSKQTTGFTGADICAIVREAKLIAVMNDKDCITTAHLEEAIDKKIFKGNRSEKEQYGKDKEIVAYHEAGHAVVTYLLGCPIARASIIGSTSGVGGFVMQSEKKSQFYTKIELENQVQIAYGGRCSEEIKFKDVTTGASSDITQATNIIQTYILKYGFLKKFGMLDVEVLTQNNMINSEEVLSLMSELSRELEEKTFSLLQKNYNLVEILAVKLLEAETLSGDEIKELLSSNIKGVEEC